ncbi:hypothetical protein GF337_13250 [candidate division KSB1 bacterium]|nr:hypothetical protein [candidate division KSB1 bacterium]
MNILGVSAFFHDAAACLLQDGKLIAAASEERFTRIKNDSSFPVNAVEYCLREGKIIIDDVDYVIFYEKPFRKFDRILTTCFASYPGSIRAFLKELPAWLKQKLWMPRLIEHELHYEGPILFCDHQLSHAAAAFLLSPFEQAAILTVDSRGEWDTASYGLGNGTKIDLHKIIRYPHSLGLLYSAFTYYLGFNVNSDEYKVMELASYGTPRFIDKVKQLIDIREDGSFKLNLKFFGYHHSSRMTNARFHRLFGGPPRILGEEIKEFHVDIAASIQSVIEEILLKIAQHLHRETGLSDLCFAGGLAFNCYVNGKLLRETPFKNLHIQPAAGDAGAAIGAACFAHNSLLKNKQRHELMHLYLGPGFHTDEIKLFLSNEGISFMEYHSEQLVEKTAALIAEDKVIGWFHGRMEFGPRGLGNRGILANPGNAGMKNILIKKIKSGKDFLPIAAAILQEDAAEYFEFDRVSPLMSFVAQVRDEKRAEIPAVTHVDGSARLQIVNREQNPLFYRLLEAFKRKTGCPVLINTSFNLCEEPIVCTPREAFRFFQETEMDCLVMGNCLIEKQG